MEYLTTYGWAILIISVVLAVLFQIGVFNPNFFMPRVLPGSCKVLRPNGPGALQFISLGGVCTGGLPQFVMFSRGVGSYVQVHNSNTITNVLNIQGNTITITAWVYVAGSPYHDIVDKENQYGMKLDYNNQPHACTPSNNQGFCLEWDTSNNWIGNSFPIPNAAFNTWMFFAVSKQGNNKYWYANGNQIGNTIVTGDMAYSNANFTIGAISPTFTGYGEAEWFNGWLANVQVYNTSLSPSDIQSLYQTGIGSAPINLQNLIGWWPLNGDGQDYSGNGNHDVPANIAYENQWTSGYTVP